VVVNDALDVLDPESRMRIRDLLMRECADIGVINIGHDQPEFGFYLRRLHLVVDSTGVKFEPEREHGMGEPPKSATETLSAE
jgi:hypothetical protein